jgi:hypothetical protein
MKALWTALVLLVASPLPLLAQVTREDIRKLLAAHISEQTILAYVQRNGPMDVLSAQDLGELKDAGASDSLLKALIQAETSTLAATPYRSTERSYPSADSTTPNVYSYASPYDAYPYSYYYPYYYSTYYPYYPYSYWPWFGFWASSAFFFHNHDGHFHDGHFHDGHVHDGHSAVVHDGHVHVVSPGVSTFRQPSSFQHQGMTTTVRPQTVAPHTMVAPHTVAPHGVVPHGSSMPQGGGGGHGGGGHGGGGGHH